MKTVSKAATIFGVAGLVVALMPGVASAHASPGRAGSRLVRDSAAAGLSVPRGARELGQASGSEPLNLQVVLAPRDPAAATAEVASLYDPSSPSYHHWLRAGQFVADYGPSSTEISQTEAWLHTQGITNYQVSGFSIKASSPVAQAEQAFGTKLNTYSTASGARGLVPATAPLVPAGLASSTVTSILGLNTLPAATPSVGVGTGTSTSSCTTANSQTSTDNFTAQQVGHNYEIDQLINAGMDGQGETIALYELAAHQTASTSAYMSCFGLTNSLTTDSVDGGGGTTSADEADIDIEEVASEAPDANLISYEAPNTGAGAYADWAAIVDQDQAQVVSSSWGTCEPEGNVGEYDTLFEQAAAQGQSIEVDAGDSGAEGCDQMDGSDAVAVDYPASSPYVTTVGGTTLSANGDETAWNYCQGEEGETACQNDGYGAGGGGVSASEPASAAQEAITGNSMREVPDLSANAGTGTIFNVAGTYDSWIGTSISTPMVAAMIADRDTACVAPTGLFATSLYTAQKEGNGLYGTGLNDITTGDNDVMGANDGNYKAGVGYDMATGLGTPLATGLTCSEVTSVTPDVAAAGAQVTVSGYGLENATIDFGGTAAQVVSASATSAVVDVPAGTGVTTVTALDPALGAGTDTTGFTYSGSTTAPGTPGAPSAVAGNGQATVTVAAPTTGGAPTSYIVTATDTTNSANGGQVGTVTGASGSVTITGLTNGDSYTFADTATNSAGTSGSSAASNSVTPTAPAPAVMVPGTPGAPTAVAGNAQATVTVAAPSTGSVPTSYIVTATDTTNSANGGEVGTVTGASGSVTITGLTNGDSYTFSDTATNSAGTSGSSVASNSVIPTAPVSTPTPTDPTPTPTPAPTDPTPTPRQTDPNAPAAPHATAGNTTATVTVTAPTSGPTPTSYLVTGADTTNPALGGQDCTINAASGSCTVHGLTNGDHYVFVAVASNASGSSAASGLSNSVIPTAPHVQAQPRTALQVSISGPNTRTGGQRLVETIKVTNTGQVSATDVKAQLIDSSVMQIVSDSGWTNTTSGPKPGASRTLGTIGAGHTDVLQVTIMLRHSVKQGSQLRVCSDASNAPLVGYDRMIG